MFDLRIYRQVIATESVERRSATSEARLGRRMHDLMGELYPFHRAITGDGVRDTLRLLSRELPLEIHEVPSGERVFDWETPPEWRFRDAYIKDASGARVVDVRDSNLHVISYSMPVRKTMSWRELDEKIVSLPEQPDSIPYRTAHCRDDWGFCLTERTRQQLRARGDDELYDVCIDASLEPGSLSYGELELPGERDEEVLFSTHVCHPSLANDNLSGIAVAWQLAQELAARDRRFTYRFVFLPATIGAITWLSRNRRTTNRVRAGLVLSCLGDPGPCTYKRSRQGVAEIDRASAHVLQGSGEPCEVIDFEPFGYDERQFCSPGFNLAMGRLTRTPNGQFPEYHTSADDLEFVRPEYLEDSLDKCLAIVDILENNCTYRNLNPHGEPRLGKRGLYDGFGAAPDQEQAQKATLWVLNYSDGNHSLLDIAERSGMSFSALHSAALTLTRERLLVLQTEETT